MRIKQVEKSRADNSGQRQLSDLYVKRVTCDRYGHVLENGKEQRETELKKTLTKEQIKYCEGLN